jgi:hypothetical protein
MVVNNFTPKELGEPSATHSEVNKMPMKSVFLAVGGWLPQLSGREMGNGHFAVLCCDKTSLFSGLV